jgi:hypothetical protein
MVPSVISEYLPSIRFGKVHIYNNYYNCPNNLYCVWSRIKAECLIENNYFKSVRDPYSIHVEDEGPEDYGKISASGNIFDNCTGTIDDGNDTVFIPSYSYTLDNAEDTPIIVQNGAGADGNDTFLPHWAFGPYGDFDRSGIVDTNDLSQFAEYWLVSDCNQLANADYNGDCNVNFYEFSLLAGDGTVFLDWGNNSEGDLAGYNIYRSTTYGGGYSKLNTSLLNGSNYIDNTVSDGTMYYYVVTAVDTSSNESLYSSEISAEPNIGNPSVIIQESTYGFCSVDGVTETKNGGYTGVKGYANTDNASGKGINWKINIPSDGTYTLKWRYANLSGDRTAKLLVNGSEVLSSISFPSTGAWITWSYVSVDVSLTAGIKDIRLERTTSNGLANIDYLQTAGNNPQAANCN